MQWSFHLEEEKKKWMQKINFYHFLENENLFYY